MALIDTFLKLMDDKRAERLVLVSDQVPFLLKSGESIELSMPVLRIETVRRIAQEIAGDSTSAEVSVSTRREGTFRATDGASFGFLIDPTWAGVRIEIHPEVIANQRTSVADEALSATFTPKIAVSAVPSPAILANERGRLDPELLGTLDTAISQNVSDIFLSSGKPPRVRKNGLIEPLDAPAPTAEQILRLVPDDAAMECFDRAGNVDFAVQWVFSSGRRRIRINVFRYLDGVAAALRPIRQRIPQITELSLPPDLLQLTDFPSGLVLVTGTSGSGKSTTLASLIDHINRTRARHVITIEDPIEYEHRDVQCLIHQREVGANVESFAGGLRAALRENPDVILLGELRDLATISSALTAAETGHLVFATLHSGSATSAVNRIVDVFPGHQQSHVRTQLALSLRAVVSQRLIPARSRGLVPAIEKLLVTPAVANGIREGHDHYMRNAMLTGSEDGMVTLERSLATLVRERIIDREVAFQHAMDPKSLLSLLGG
jgi:twitching motility protein PilT